MDRRYGTIIVPHDLLRDINKVKKLYVDLEFTPLSTLFRPELAALEIMGYSPKFKKVRIGSIPANYQIKTVMKHYQFDEYKWTEFIKYDIIGE